MQKVENGLFRTGSGEPQEINIKDMVTKYLRYWYLFVAGVVICFIAAKMHIRYNITPKYHISSTLLIKDNVGTAGLSSGLSGGLGEFTSNRSIGNEIIILRSRNLMQRVLSELSLNTSYFVEGRFKDVEVFKDDLPITLLVNRLDSVAFGKTIKIQLMDNNNFGLIEYKDGEEIKSSHKFGQEIDKPYATFTVIGSNDVTASKDIVVRFHDIRKQAEKYSQRLMIELEEKGANVLRLTLVDAVPQRSIMILNKLVEVYNKEAVEDKNLVGLSTIEFLDERIAFLSTELVDVEKNVEQYKQQNSLTDVGSNAQMYMQTANEYNKELVDYELRLDIINSLEAYLKQEELKLVPSSLNISDPTLNGLIAKFNELQLEKQRMLRNIQPSSSIILNMDDQLINLRGNIMENLRNIKSGLVITLENLRSNTAQFQSKIRQVPSIERELLEINRQQSIKQAIYLFLLQRREETGLNLASTAANSRIIDAASGGDSPFNTNTTSIYLAAIMLGLLVPFAFVYGKDMLNDKVTDRKEIERMTDIPILGEIFHSENKEVIQITEGVHSVVAETFRLVRANLHFASLGKENKVILVTSSRGGEGKTFFSINLGASLALAGKKVLLLGFDLRKPKMMKNLSLTDRVGITDYLVSNEVSLGSLVTPVKEVPGLFVIGAGTLPPNPAELMMSPKISVMMEELKQHYDFIMLDSSPIGMVADSFNLAPYADSTLYIVRYNYSYKAQMANIQDIYQNKKLKNLMVVLNDAKENNGPGYGYGYGYGDGDGKTNGNGKAHKKKSVHV